MTIPFENFGTFKTSSSAKVVQGKLNIESESHASVAVVIYPWYDDWYISSMNTNIDKYANNEEIETVSFWVWNESMNLATIVHIPLTNNEIIEKCGKTRDEVRLVRDDEWFCRSHPARVFEIA